MKIKISFSDGAPEQIHFTYRIPNRTGGAPDFILLQSYPTTIADGKFRVQIPYGDSSIYTHISQQIKHRVLRLEIKCK